MIGSELNLRLDPGANFQVGSQVESWLGPEKTRKWILG